MATQLWGCRDDPIISTHCPRGMHVASNGDRRWKTGICTIGTIGTDKGVRRTMRQEGGKSYEEEFTDRELVGEGLSDKVAFERWL